jgi:excisionase family DNA binding protein
MNRPNMINPYLQMSRLVGRELDFGMVEHFVGKYIDDAIRHRGQSYSDASNDLKQFFVQLSDAVFQASVNYEERIIPIPNFQDETQIQVIQEEDGLMTVDEISKIMRVTTQQIRNFINSGQLKSVKLSERGTRVKKSDFESFLESRKF